jgi:hypothetical protein
VADDLGRESLGCLVTGYFFCHRRSKSLIRISHSTGPLRMIVVGPYAFGIRAGVQADWLSPAGAEWIGNIAGLCLGFWGGRSFYSSV